MTRWTGKTITLQIGAKRTYKLELKEESEPSPRATWSSAGARSAVNRKQKPPETPILKAEIEKRS